MSMNNEIRLIGNIGHMPELHVSEKGVKVLKISLATNDNYTNKEGVKVVQTEWHNLVMFSKRAEVVAKYCKKGSKVAVNGKLTTRHYTDKDGVERYISEIIVQDVLFLDNKASD